MEFRILGPLEASAEGVALQLGGTKQRALLALLLLNANDVVPLDRIVDELWGERPPETAIHAAQVYVSNLRKALEPRRSAGVRETILETRSPGYLIRVREDDFDLHRFERLLARGRAEAASGAHAEAAATLREALGLWRGAPLADFVYEPFAQAAIARLEEIRLGAVEERIAADLAAGRHAELVAELEALVAAHPLRERARGLLMLALYRSGRQAEALSTYQDARRALVEELGIDPSPPLQELERSILNHDPQLAWQPARPVQSAAPEVGSAMRTILCVGLDGPLRPVVALAAPLARSLAPHAVIVARLVEPARGGELAAAVGEVNDLRDELGGRSIPARAAAFTSSEPGADVARLASEQEVDLLLLADELLLEGKAATGALLEILDEAPCDVALAVRPGAGGDGAVLVPFGGGEHDWAALELGAWLASARETGLRLLGTAADEQSGRRDASRLLATASLAVQQLVGVPSEPVLTPPGPEGVLEAAAGAGLLILAVPDTWRQHGLGETRATIAREAAPPTLLVRRGIRPGGLAPRATLTRYTWSVAAAAQSTSVA